MAAWTEGIRRNWVLAGIGTTAGALIVGGSYLAFGLNPGYSIGIVVLGGAIGWGLYRFRNGGPLPWSGGLPLGRALGFSAAGLVLALGVIQAVPYGRAHANPPVGAEPSWDSPATRDLAVRACYDCHSNETDWPWYSNVAPFSWALADHVRVGRRILNFSEWDRPAGQAGETRGVVLEGEMPPPYYTLFGLVHGDARLTDAERQALADGLFASLGG